jgi:hypothetical protein
MWNLNTRQCNEVPLFKGMVYYSETERLNTRFLKFLWKVIIYMVAQIRIGQGMDVHAFEEGNFVTLAGIQIPLYSGSVSGKCCPISPSAKAPNKASHSA